MDVTPLIKADAQVVQSYANGQFRISGNVYQEPVLVTQTQTVVWAVESVEKGVRGLSLDDFSQLVAQADQIDVLLLGCGAKIAFLEPKLKKALSEAGLSVDVMDTGAACRTFNVLMAEGRRVAAAMLPV